MVVAAVILAGIALSFGLENRRRTRNSLNETKKRLEESIEKIKETSLKVQERFSSADVLIQRQQNELLQHIISLSKAGGQQKIEDQDVILKNFLESKITDQMAQMIAQTILDEIKKKW